MSFMDMCKPQGPLEVLTPEERRVTDYYQRSTMVAERVAAVIEDLRAGRIPLELKNELFAWEDPEITPADEDRIEARVAAVCDDMRAGRVSIEDLHALADAHYSVFARAAVKT